MWKRLRGKNFETRRRSHSHRKLLPDLETSLPGRIFKLLGSVTPFRFFFLCFNKISLAVILCLSPPLYFEKRVFLEVHRSRGIVFWGGLYRFSPIPNLDEDSESLSWWNFGYWVDAIIGMLGWFFWGCWDTKNVFYTREGCESWVRNEMGISFQRFHILIFGVCEYVTLHSKRLRALRLLISWS